MKISRFIHIIDNNNVWDAVSRRKIALSEEEINYIRKNKNKDVIECSLQKLIDLNILTTKEWEEQYIKKMIEETTDKQFQSLYLITTTNCNLDCDYCFYRSNNSKSLQNHQNMTFDVAKKSLDIFFDIVKDNVKNDDYWQQITFYGGEPLLNKELLKYAIPYAFNKFKDSDTNIVINTNLTLLDNEIINLFKTYNVEVQVSLDGKKDVHNMHRKDINGFGSFDIVMNNIKKLLENNIKVLPMITANNDNVNNFSETLNYIINELNLNEYAVNILITDSYGVNQKYSKTLAYEMLKSYICYNNKAVDYVFEDLYNKIISKDARLAKSSCGVTRKITVFPDKKVYACQALEKYGSNYMGTIDSDFANNKNWEIWRKRNRFNNDECLDCEALTLCGGGCATGSLNGTGSIYGIDRNQCEYTRALVKKILK